MSKYVCVSVHACICKCAHEWVMCVFIVGIYMYIFPSSVSSNVLEAKTSLETLSSLTVVFNTKREPGLLREMTDARAGYSQPEARLSCCNRK